MSRTPVVSTHSCIRALCDHPRNMDDEQLDALRDVGGVVQVTAVAAFLRADAKPEAVTVADFADHIDYAVRRIGIEHVGISSDFDGGGGFTGWHDAGESANITAELIRRGYGRHGDCGTLGRQFPARAADRGGGGGSDAHGTAAGRDRGSGARPGHLAHGRADPRGQGRGGGAEARHRAGRDADRHRRDVRQRRGRGDRRRSDRRPARSSVHRQQGAAAQRLAHAACRRPASAA